MQGGRGRWDSCAGAEGGARGGVTTPMGDTTSPGEAATGVTMGGG